MVVKVFFFFSSSSSFRFACFKITFFVSVINLTIILLHIQVVFIHIRFVKTLLFSYLDLLLMRCLDVSV
ncbi:hypothetical protein L2E82_20576 [Cichorium intybus]|uniref:Uncharacterized protein n=1 Tax=Cichorium intybus TaxID=13427 RepID=A0ACB9DTQ6_CICIN|nr:hypothetical protein L2E82_20576 [Cichorium intybus]